MSKKIALQIGDDFKYKEGVYVGKYRNFDIIIRYDNASLLYNMYFSIKSLKDLDKLNKLLAKKDKHAIAKYKNNILTITHYCETIKDMPKLIHNIIDDIIDFLDKNKIKNVCRSCHNIKKTYLVDYDSAISFYCDDCFNDTIEEYKIQIKKYKDIKENVILGVIGAIIGALPGLIIFLVLDYLNFSSFFASLVIMLGSAYGYKWFAKTLKEKGLVISLIIGFIIIILSNEISNAYNLYIEYSSLYKINLFDAYKAMPYYITNSEVFRSSYIQSLIITIIFGIIGSLSNIGLYRRYIAINKIKKI